MSLFLPVSPSPRLPLSRPLFPANLDPLRRLVVVFDRIDDQVVEDFADARVVGPNGGQRSWSANLDAALPQPLRDHLQRFADHFIEGDGQFLVGLLGDAVEPGDAADRVEFDVAGSDAEAAGGEGVAELVERDAAEDAEDGDGVEDRREAESRIASFAGAEISGARRLQVN